MKRSIVGLLSAAFFLFFAAGSCSINDLAIRMVADAVSGEGGEVFTADDDPELIADALPFALKLYESLLEQAPDHRGLILSTGSGYIMYANAFLQTPAMMLPFTEYEQKQKMIARAKKLHLRGRDILLEGFSLRYPAIATDMDRETLAEILKKMDQNDVSFLYWIGAGWMSAYAIDPFDLSVSANIDIAIALLKRALEIEPDFSNGALHDLFIQYYAAFPMEKSEEKAREHFDKAVEASDGMLASPYVSLASTISVQNQDYLEFKTLLEAALDIDVDEFPASRLANIISRRKARWYLENAEDFFIIDLESGES
jgi:predicted anti-sigma-YlaC factor YlaD